MAVAYAVYPGVYWAVADTPHETGFVPVVLVIVTSLAVGALIADYRAAWLAGTAAAWAVAGIVASPGTTPPWQYAVATLVLAAFVAGLILLGAAITTRRRPTRASQGPAR